MVRMPRVLYFCIMQKYQNYNLQHWNTFHIPAIASTVFVLEKDDDFHTAPFHLMKGQIMVIGSGSNLLFCADYQGTVIKVENKGVTLVEEHGDDVLLQVAAGEEWECVVNYCLEHGYGGPENLTLIPGQTGSAVVQNIGAYGVEIKDVVERVEAVEIASGKLVVFQNQGCEFAYRSSIFKARYKGQYLVKSVVLRLTKKPVLKLDYGSIHKYLGGRDPETITVNDVASVIRDVRRSKLPDYQKIGNAGSFFKNPVVENDVFNRLKTVYPDMPAYPLEDGTVKLAAGWLIEKAGWKGFREGDAGVYPLQALVIVNYGNASGRDIYQLSERIKNDVWEKFGVSLQREVMVIGTPGE